MGVEAFDRVLNSFAVTSLLNLNSLSVQGRGVLDFRTIVCIERTMSRE